MKTLSPLSRALVLWVATTSVFHHAALALFAQGTVQFNNTATTTLSTNSGLFPPPGQLANQSGLTAGAGHYTIGLYIAPQGTTDSNAFTLMGPTTLSQTGLGNGRFNGNPLPNNFAISNNTGQTIAFQIRAWSTFAGATYGEVLAKTNLSSRYLGVSAIGEVTPATGLTPTPSLFGTAPGQVGGFTLWPPLLSLSVNDIVAYEFTPGAASPAFTVSLSFPSTQTVTVVYATANGTAFAPADYEGRSGALVFSPGETNKQIPLLILADGIPEPDETFTLNLSNPLNAAIARASGTCTITELRMASVGFHVDVAFTTVNGARYRVERTDNATIWTPVTGATNVLGTGSNVSITDSNASCLPTRAYRAVRFQ